MNPQWLDLLQKVKNSEISVEEAAKRLDALDTVQGESTGVILPTTDDFHAGDAPQDDAATGMGGWKDAWLVPFWIGTVIFVAGALLMGWAYSAAGKLNFWFFCAGLPMLLGLLALFVGWWSRTARWVHVRVQDSDGSKVNISLPIPLQLASWFLRVFGPHIPALKEQNLDFLPDILNALGQTRDPIWVDVDDEDGDRVKIYIG